jgi:hypothetical protein
MTDPVFNDLCKHQQAEARSEAEEMRIDARATELAQGYWAEYMSTGRISDLDLNEADLEVLALESPQNHSFYDIVWGKCYDLVEADPDAYIDDELSWWNDK